MIFGDIRMLTREITPSIPTPVKHSRLDYFLVDRPTLSRVSSTSIGHITWSDHASVDLSLETTYNTLGRPPGG